MTENGASSRRNGGLRDALDEKLLALLGENARLTLTALAQKLSLSRTAVQGRIARLEREGVILGYRAVVAGPPETEGVGAVLSLTFTQRPCAPVVEQFRHWPEIAAYYSVTGLPDAYMIVRVGDGQALSALVDRLSAIPGVGKVQSAMVLKSGLG